MRPTRWQRARANVNCRIFPGVTAQSVRAKLEELVADPEVKVTLNAAGIPTYGIEPLFLGPDFGHIHGLNEYVGVQSLLEARDFLYRLVRMYAEQQNP